MKLYCECGKINKFIKWCKGFSKFCSVKCSTNNIETKSKRYNTNLKIYGSYCSMNNIEVKMKNINNRIIPDKSYTLLQNKKNRYLNYGFELISNLDNDYVCLKDLNYCNHEFTIQQFLFRKRIKENKVICTKCNWFLEDLLWKKNYMRC